ncbi:MAG: hypothetical protein ACLQVI_17350 [Polyangiaceae bacterium]|jgi:hypothetical protein
MRATELACAAIVLLYAFVRLRAPGASRGAIAARLLVLVCAAWVGEDSVIRAYGFYGYAPEWSLFVDRVPLLIVAIWPVVIDSAHVLARSLVADASRASRVALAGGLIVLADASLIEPIAVHAHLWSWSAANARAVFEVPAIGILGWGYFAAAAIATLELAERQKAPDLTSALTIVVAPLATHAALIMSWWGAFRWVGAELGPWLLAGIAWCAALPIALGAWAKEPVPLRAVLSRAPGAAFFFALLGATARGRPDLVLYALAFAPPYVALVVRASSNRRVSPSRSKSTSWHEKTMT